MSDDKFPNGKLNDEDEGELAIRISTESGNIRLDFAEPMTWFALPPEMAIDLAASIISAARKTGCKTPLVLKL